MARRPDPPSLFAALLEARGGTWRRPSDHGGPDRRPAHLRPGDRREPRARPSAGPRHRARRDGRRDAAEFGRRRRSRFSHCRRPAGCRRCSIIPPAWTGAVGVPHRRAAPRHHLPPLCRAGQARCSRPSAWPVTVEIVWLEDVRAQLGFVDKLYGAGRAAFRRCSAPPSRHRRAIRPRSCSPRVGGRAERGRAEPRQSARQPAPARGAGRFQPGRPLLNAAADVPQLRADRRISAAAAVRRAGVSVPVAAALPDRAGDRLRTGATILFGTDTFLAGYARARQPLRFLCAALCFRRSRAGARGDPANLGRAVRQAHPRRLRRHRMLAGDRGQYADAFQAPARSAACCRWSSTGSSRSAGHRRGRRACCCAARM